MSKSKLRREEVIGKEQGDIQTFVFIDFETTGLLQERAKVTEMCLLAVTKSDLMQKEFPRVINKLVLCFNPGKSLTPKASELSGLTHDMLKEQRVMTSQSVGLMNAFLSHLQEPICLLAHWGNGFDFPLLKSELHSINQSGALKEALLCADTLEAFRSLGDLPSAAENRRSGSHPEKRKISSTSDPSGLAPLKKFKSLPTDSKGAAKTAAKPATQKAVPKMTKFVSLPTQYSSTSFKLPDIYYRVFGEKPLKSHTAEGDCIALLEIAQRSPGFIRWVNRRLSFQKFAQHTLKTDCFSGRIY